MPPPSPDRAGPAEFVDRNLRGARFRGCDLSHAVLRGVMLAGAQLESPWLFEADELFVNGVNVIPFVDAELNRRFPGRAGRHATEPEGLRAAWAALEGTWAATLERVAALPPGTVEESVAGEWSFATTLRHLILATDLWLGRGILRRDRPFHPIGQVDDGTAGDGFTLPATATPTYAEVLAVRAERLAMVRDFLASVTAEQLVQDRPNPHDPDHSETVLSCVHTILEEEWEHHRYAVRDLDALTSRNREP